MQHVSKPNLKDAMQTVLPYCDIVVGNSDEALALADNFKFNATELQDVLKMLADLPKHNKQRKRIVMITQQELPVIVYSGLSSCIGSFM